MIESFTFAIHLKESIMKTIDDFNFEHKKALIRVDFNVPLDEEFNVTDTNRIEAAKPSIIKVLEDGGSAVLMSHLGRPKGQKTLICPCDIFAGRFLKLLGCK